MNHPVFIVTSKRRVARIPRRTATTHALLFLWQCDAT